MALSTIIDAVFNPIFGWLLHVPPILAILFLALLLGLISTLLQKYLTNQARMKRLREDTKKYQAEMKKLRNNPEQMMKVQQKVMPIQMELMKESFKPLLVSLVPFLLIFFWLSSHFAYYQLLPDTPFVISATFEDGIAGNATLESAPQLAIEGTVQEIKDGTAKWVAKGKEGSYTVSLLFAGSQVGQRKVLVTTQRKYETPVMPLRGIATSFNVENRKLIPIPGLSIFGWHPGWIFYYIVFSIPLSLLLKKWLKVV